MSKPYDAATRQLIELGPIDWLRFLHVPVARPDQVRVLDSDLSSFTAEVDHAIWIGDDLPWIEHVELQAGRDPELPERICWYSALLRRKHNVPVRSSVVLLRAAADGPDLNGIHEHRDRLNQVYNQFRYNIIRVWQTPVDEVLAAGLTVLPLAPVARVDPGQLPRILTSVAQRLKAEADPATLELFWAATRILMGLRYRPGDIEAIAGEIMSTILGIRGIEASSEYQRMFDRGKEEGLQAGLQEGRQEGQIEGRQEGQIEGIRAAILRVGTRRFGQPPADVEKVLSTTVNLTALQNLLDRVLDVQSWQDVLRDAPGDQGT